MDIDENDPSFSRANRHDYPVPVLLTADEYVWSKNEAKDRDLSHSAYIRSLIIADRRKVEARKLSLSLDDKNTSNKAEILSSLMELLDRAR